MCLDWALYMHPSFLVLYSSVNDNQFWLKYDCGRMKGSTPAGLHAHHRTAHNLWERMLPPMLCLAFTWLDTHLGTSTEYFFPN
jgi:hypothetical protein